MESINYVCDNLRLAPSMEHSAVCDDLIMSDSPYARQTMEARMRESGYLGALDENLLRRICWYLDVPDLFRGHKFVPSISPEATGFIRERFASSWRSAEFGQLIKHVTDDKNPELLRAILSMVPVPNKGYLLDSAGNPVPSFFVPRDLEYNRGDPLKTPPMETRIALDVYFAKTSCGKESIFTGTTPLTSTLIRLFLYLGACRGELRSAWALSSAIRFEDFDLIQELVFHIESNKFGNVKLSWTCIKHIGHPDRSDRLLPRIAQIAKSVICPGDFSTILYASWYGSPSAISAWIRAFDYPFWPELVSNFGMAERCFWVWDETKQENLDLFDEVARDPRAVLLIRRLIATPDFESSRPVTFAIINKALRARSGEDDSAGGRKIQKLKK